MTQVDRATRRVLSYDVVGERTWDALQENIEPAAPAQQYYSDAIPTYETLVSYPGKHAVAPGKSQTYSVEADNAELRHYLAPLGRRSRCSPAPSRLCAGQSSSSSMPGTGANCTRAPIRSRDFVEPSC